MEQATKSTEKRNKIIYWIFTIWMSLGMASSGIFQLLKTDFEIEGFKHLGYPIYFLSLLGAWKILGVIAILLPRLPLLKEWAYAGFFFTMTGATFSHISSGDSFKDFFPSILLTVLIFLSWYFRPANRKINTVHS